MSSNRTWGTSIEGLRVKQQQLAASIYLTNKDNVARLRELSGEYKKVSAELQKLTNEYLKLNQAQKSSNESQEKGVAGLYGLIQAARGFIAIQLAREIVDAALAMEELAGKTEAVGSAFNRQIPNSTTLLVRLRQATHNTVGDLELMQKALQAQNFGIAVEKLPQLLEFAAVRAQQTGQSVDYLVNSIVTGIGRKSLLILDNLGISATRLKAEFHGASLASQEVGDVTAAVSRIAQQEMAKMGGYIETNETSVKQLATAYEGLQVQIAKTFTSAGASPSSFLKDQIEGLATLIKITREGKTASEEFRDQMRAQDVAFSEQLFVTHALKGSREQNIKVLDAETQRLAQIIGQYARYRQTQNDVIKSLEEEYEAQRKNLLSTNDELLATKEQIELRKRLRDANLDEVKFNEDMYRVLSRRLQILKETNEETKEELGLIEKQRELIKTITEEQSTAKTEAEVADLNDELREEQKELQRLLDLSLEQKGLSNSCVKGKSNSMKSRGKHIQPPKLKR